MKTKLLLTLLLGLSTTAEAALESRAGGMVYDTDLNITWVADANLFKTQADSNANLVSQIITANGGVIHDKPNIYDTNGIYTLTASDFNAGNGQLDWWGAQAWVGFLNTTNYNGYSDWRLPTSPQSPLAATATSSELGQLFYNELGGVAGNSIGTTHNANYNLFSNVQPYVYWSGSEYKDYFGSSWVFTTTLGTLGNDVANKVGQFYALTVRSGDVAAVPVPGAVWLFGSGLIGLIGLARKRKVA